MAVLDLDYLFDKLCVLFEKALDMSQENLVLTVAGYGALSWLAWRLLLLVDPVSKPDTDTDAVAQKMHITSNKTDECMKWFLALKMVNESHVLDVKEWTDDGGIYREQEGWKGNDFMHSPNSPVRIYDYIMFPPGKLEDGSEVVMDYAIVSAVQFSVNAESHKGLCHGGTMCAVMDDAIGWCGFCESGVCKPWSGYTVQIDTCLKRAIRVESVLKIVAWIERREGPRKIYIAAKLVSADGEIVHATGKGLYLKSDTRRRDIDVS